MRKFNVVGLCVPDKHYMVDTSYKLVKIKEMIDEGLYFTINRGAAIWENNDLKSASASA